ncbi:MAG TPA: alpha/beta fold hydrolase [Gallionella sp.]|nr:alpha/beta fold hydrolase [Gallionella sp.]
MAVQRKTNFPGAVGQLEGMVHLPEGEPRGIAVVAHPLPIEGGTMNNKVVTTLANTLAEQGLAVLRFNFRGVGESEGSYDEGNGEVRDVVAACEFMRHEFGELPLIAAGFSFGGYVQARAAEHTKPQQLVLVAPAVGRFAMPQVPHNTLLVHGDLDDIVPLAQLLEWARPQRLAVTVLAGAEHFFHRRLVQLQEVVRNNLAPL